MSEKRLLEAFSRWFVRQPRRRTEFSPTLLSSPGAGRRGRKPGSWQKFQAMASSPKFAAAEGQTNVSERAKKRTKFSSGQNGCKTLPFLGWLRAGRATIPHF
jgi:hypothetical protein